MYNFGRKENSNSVGFQQDINFENRVRNVWVIQTFVRKVKKKQFLSNKTSLEGSRYIKNVFLSSTQLTEQHGLCNDYGVFSLSHCIISVSVY